MDYDTNPIQVFTQYSYDQMRGFQRFHYRKARRNSVILLVFLVFMFAVNIVPVILYVGIENFISLPYVLGGAFFWLTIVILPLLMFSGVFYTRKTHAKAVKLVQNGQNYSFCGNDFALSAEQPDNIWQSRTAYSVILNVWETKDMFYLYIAKNQAYLVDKGGFRTGSAEELRALLQNHVPPKKYKMYKV